MICHTTDLNGQTIQGLGAAAKISMNLGTEGRVLKGRFAAFGREDSVEDHAGKGLGHGVDQGFMRDGHNPVGVEPNLVCFDRVSQGSANPGLEDARPLVLKMDNALTSSRCFLIKFRLQLPNGLQIARLPAKEFHDLHGCAVLREWIDFEDVQGLDTGDAAVGVFLEQGI